MLSVYWGENCELYPYGSGYKTSLHGVSCLKYIALCEFSWHSLGCTFVGFTREGCFDVWILIWYLCLVSGIMLQVLLLELLPWLFGDFFNSCQIKRGVKQFSPDFAARRWNIFPCLLRTSLSSTSLACSLSFLRSQLVFIVWISSLQPTVMLLFLRPNGRLQTHLCRMTRLWAAGWLIFVKMCLLMEPLSASTGNWPKSAEMSLEPLGRKWVTWGTQWTAATLTRARCTETIPWLWHSWRLTTTTDVGSQKKLQFVFFLKVVLSSSTSRVAVLTNAILILNCTITF